MAVSVPSRRAPSLTLAVIWWRVVAPMNCSSRVNSHFTGRPVFSVASTQRSSVSISCLPPNPPPTRSVNTCTSRARRPKMWQSFCWAMNGACELVRTWTRPSDVGPGDRAVRLEMHVLHAGGGIDALMHDIGGGETLRRAADLAVDIDIDVAVGGDPLVVQQRRFRAHRLLRIEHCGQDFVLHLEQPTGRFRRRLGLRDNGGDTLPDEAHHIVEHVGVVGIDEVILVGGRAVEPARHVFPGEDCDDTRHGSCSLASNAENPRMRMRRAQHLEMQQPFHRDSPSCNGLAR